MKFAVGYQLAEAGEESFVDIVGDYREHVAEVYFPWADLPSGRGALLSRRGYTDWTGQRRLEADLVALREMGVKLDLLLNANCYGRHAVSRFLENQVVSVLEHLDGLVGGADVVTTASPAVARTVQKRFGSIDVRASVNLRIGTVRAMEYVAGLFDSFHVQRERNRDLAALRELLAWAGARGKRLHLLVNSGCLPDCPGQVFHDNMVAHEAEIDETDNIPGWTPHVCWHFFRDRRNWPALLGATWVRPEDLHHYEGLFETVKLATRMHARPRAVIDAYVRRRWRGNLLDLMEPAFSPALAPHILDNEAFPDDFFQRTATCDRRCDRCDYCRDVLQRVLVRADGAAPAPLDRQDHGQTRSPAGRE